MRDSLLSYKIIFSCILLIAIVTRFYKLGTIPNGLTWDEAAIGYNAYGLITNHRDEWLKRTPIVFQSFGDYKSPLLIYLSTLPVAIFGLTSFAVRLPIALAGVGLVVLSYFLGLEITKQKKVGLIAMFLASISPWGIHYSRLGFESMLACLLVSLGVYSFLLWARSFKFWILAFGFWNFAMSLYAYHSAKIVVPLSMLMLFIRYRREIFAHKLQLVVATAIASLLLLPLAYATFFGKANDRALSTTVFSQPAPLAALAVNVTRQFSLGFLLQGSDVTYRHSTKQVGVSHPVELGLVIVGIAAICLSPKYRKYWWIPVLLLIGMMPAILGIDGPHSNRALSTLPWLTLAAGVGAYGLLDAVSKSTVPSSKFQLKVDVWKLTLTLAIVCIFSFVGYARVYLKVYHSAVALSEFGYGYEEAISYLRTQESQFERIYVTNHFGQAYIYLLFYKQLSPIEFRGGGLANYVISDNPVKDAAGHPNVLILGTKEDIPTMTNVVKEFTYPDGEVVFRVLKQ